MTPFESDGVYAGIRYRTLPDFSVEAMLPAGLVKFTNMDQLIAAVAKIQNVTGKSRSTLHDVPENSNRQQASVPTMSRPLDYYSILLEAIHNTEHDSARLRALVYERARFNLKREFLFGYSSLGLSEVVQHVNDFELAVARIEANAGNVNASPTYPDQLEPREINRSPTSNGVQIMPPTEAPALFEEDSHFYQQVHNRQVGWQPSKARSRTTLLFGSTLGAIALIAAAIVASMLWRWPEVQSRIEIAHNPSSSGETIVNRNNSNEDSARSTNNSPKPSFPLPTSFGIYALSENKLFKLETLPIRAPDPRIALSAEITKPSTTTISSNKPAFIFFRRDLLNSAPEKVAVRVVARVEHETKFVGGKPSIIKLEGSWRVRNTLFEYKISPIPGQSEMVIAQTDDNQSLAAGRYALVLNGLAYDFTIEGPIQSPAHCLDEFEALNGTVFSECRKISSTDRTKSKI